MNNRTRGHNLERQVARDLKFLYPFVKTSRASSKLLDDCGVDINFVPFLIQCKLGYNKNRPKFEEERDYTKSQIGKNFPKDHPIQNLPYILIHKLNDRKQPIQVTMEYDFFLNLLSSATINESILMI